MLTSLDLKRLEGVHPDLVAVVMKAAESQRFRVVEGLRTKERQAQLVAAGASQTMNSRHLTGHAVDLAPLVSGQVRWDWPLFYPLADALKQSADVIGVDVEWGGDWKKWKDGPHWQLSWSKYP